MMKRRRFMLGAALTPVSMGNSFPFLGEATVLDGDGFKIGEDEFRLSDILAPSPAVGSMAGEAFAAQSLTALSNLLRHGFDEFRQTGEPDRWGRKPGVAVKYLAPGQNLVFQKHLVEIGAARVNPETDQFSFIEELLRAERRARSQERGLWKLMSYGVVPADNASRAIGAFNLVRGVVVKTAVAGSRGYINFGTDYRTDFTASVTATRLKKWYGAKENLPVQEGEEVMIRGFVEWLNGPSIDVTHPKQIERL